ncbi:uncharacterized protein LOC116895802 [Rattus rattus]|uniref:uncharacterized protein LOC116895802 n=1 Tax=Rattus rattus TaxID=10117 RepID=UPI0013F36378|nr:uncharacterized protein LOC116895802 [Rattus rattus]
MKSPEPESAPARAAAKAEEGAGTRDPAPPCRLPLGPVTWQAPASSTHVRGAAWVGMRLKTAQDTTTGHPGLDVSGRTRVGHEVGKRLSPARASATCDHGAPHPLHGPWTSFKWVQSRSPPSATKGISSSDPQQFSHPWVIPAAFCTKPAPARFCGSRARRTCLAALCPTPQPQVLTARPSPSGWGLCPWESRRGVSGSPSTPPPATGFPLGLGVPRCWGSRPGLRGRSPVVGSSKQLCELGPAAPTRSSHPTFQRRVWTPWEVGEASASAPTVFPGGTKGPEAFPPAPAEPCFCTEVEGAGNGRSGLGLLECSLDSRPQNCRR